MRVSGLLLSCALLAGSPCAGVPIAYRQPTGDTWDVGGTTPKAPCENIRSELVFPVPAGERPAAVAMLEASSVRRLDDQQAADLLQQGSATDLLTNLLAAQVTQLEAQRNAVFRDHVGSWSDADTVTTSDLVELYGPHYPPYRPFLVRALAGARSSPENFNIHLCGDVLLIDNFSDGDAARRFPLIVFLQAPPARAIPSWYR